MINIKTKFIGLRKVKEIEIENDLGLKLVLINYGASLFQVYLKEKELLYTSHSLKEFIFSKAYLGKIIGRTSGRIKDSIININNKTYKLFKNGKHHLHGGKGFSFKPFECEILEDDQSIKVDFYYLSKAYEDGYPGELEVKVSYFLFKNENKFRIEFSSISDEDTLCNLTSHAYWNLSSSKESIINHHLVMNANKYIEVDNELIFKNIKDVDEVFDFRKGKTLGEYLFDEKLIKNSNGYDHDFILDSKEVSLLNKDFELIINSSYPICHVYTGNYLFDPYYGVALEFEKESYNIDKLLLRKDQLYSEFIEYQIVERE